MFIAKTFQRFAINILPYIHYYVSNIKIKRQTSDKVCVNLVKNILIVLAFFLFVYLMFPRLMSLKTDMPVCSFNNSNNVLLTCSNDPVQAMIENRGYT